MKNKTVLMVTVVILLVIIPSLVFTEETKLEIDKVQSALTWALIPGGGHFYLDEPEMGGIYAGTMLSLIGAGSWLDERNHELERNDEVNTFWLLALKEWELSLFTTYRNALRSEGYDLKNRGVDDTSVGNLLLSPFRKENYSDSMVILAGMLGIAAAAYDSRNSKNNFNDISRIGILGSDANQEWGSALYGIDAFGVSLAAGVSEEAMWRGLIQNEMELTLGKRWGLYTTAGIFGAAHIVDLDGQINAGRVAIATAGGLYLGYLYQKNEHSLGKPIAAHFWYNFAVMMTSFALDPEDNPLGVKVSFGF